MAKNHFSGAPKNAQNGCFWLFWLYRKWHFINGDDGDGDDDVHDDDDDKPGEADSVGVGGLGGEHCREERAWGEVIIIIIIIINDKLGLLLMKWYLVLSMKMVFGI